MAKHNDEPQIETPNPSQETIEPTNSQNCHTKQFPLSGLSVFVSVVALILSLYVLFVNLNGSKTLIKAQTMLSNQIENLNKELTKAQEQLDAKTVVVVATQKELTIKLSQLEQQVLSSISKANDPQSYHTKKWPLFKAAYYLEAAQMNADWNANPKTSMALLAQADSVLHTLNEPKLSTVRDAIAREIAQLKSIAVVDRIGLLNQLDATQKLVEKLTVRPKTHPQTLLSTAQSATIPAWRAQWQDSLKSLEKLVVIRQNKETVKPLLSPFLGGLVKESLYLELQQAQWAVLNNDSKLFQLSINQAMNTVNRVFDKEEANTQALITELNRLQSIQFPQEKPTIGVALSLLNQWINADDSRKN